MNDGKGRPASSPQGTGGPQAQPAPAPGPAGQADTTVIAKDVTVTGGLWGRGAVLVEGTVVGEVKLDGALTVARTGVVRGPVVAESVDVAGCVEGGIAARTCLRLEMTGSITGDVTMQSFTIEDGGYFNGRSHMTKAGGEPVIVY